METQLWDVGGDPTVEVHSIDDNYGLAAANEDDAAMELPEKADAGLAGEVRGPADKHMEEKKKEEPTQSGEEKKEEEPKQSEEEKKEEEPKQSEEEKE